MKNKFSGARAASAFGALLFCATQALAYGDAAPGFYVEGGHALHGGTDTEAWALGAVLPWSRTGAGPVNGRSFAWDLFASQWRAPQAMGDGRRGYAQLGAIATWRYRFDRGGSPWFVEGGLGGTLMNHVYRTPDRSFSTAFQFTEVLGLGRSFGERGEHELSVRLQHVSNGGIRKPNPGANFVRLRYLYRF